MSVDIPLDDAPLENSGVTTVTDTFPEPVAHGCGVVATIDDLDDHRAPIGERGGLYDTAMAFWRENVGTPEDDPYIFEGFDADWLRDDRDYALLFKSKGWKAGKGQGDDYSQWYEYLIMLREVVEDRHGKKSYRKVDSSLKIQIQPQYPDLVYKNGESLQKDMVHGTGSRIQVETSYPGAGHEIVRRAHQAVSHCFGYGAFSLNDIVEESHRIHKLEAYVRFLREYLGAAVETVDQTKKLIAWGGTADVHGMQRAEAGTWVRSKVISRRFDLLGFANPDFQTLLKVYMADDAEQRDEDDPMHHPKMEAGFEGKPRGQLPHVSAFDALKEYFATIVATHCRWAGIDAEGLYADDHFAGPDADPMRFERPEGRKDQLRQRYEDAATDVYKEALSDRTYSPYDILRVIAEEQGATYDTLEARTGLARSTIRHHCRRLAEEGVVKRLGNPTLVVFVSRQLLDRAKEILDEARPSDTGADMAERAQERRDDREENEAEDVQEGGADLPAPAPSPAEEDEDLGFEYLQRIEAEIMDIVELLHDRDADLDERDVRVRRDALPRRLR